MPRTLVALVALLLVAPALAGDPDPAEYEHAIATILCDCGCHPQSVKECACGRAAEMRSEFLEIMAGRRTMNGDPADGSVTMTGDQFIDAWVAIHGENTRIAPKARGFNLLAWLGPLAGLFIATGSLILMLRRWKRSDPETLETEPAAMPIDDAYMARLRTKVEE